MDFQPIWPKALQTINTMFARTLSESPNCIDALVLGILPPLTIYVTQLIGTIFNVFSYEAVLRIGWQRTAALRVTPQFNYVGKT